MNQFLAAILVVGVYNFSFAAESTVLLDRTQQAAPAPKAKKAAPAKKTEPAQVSAAPASSAPMTETALAPETAPVAEETVSTPAAAPLGEPMLTAFPAQEVRTGLTEAELAPEYSMYVMGVVGLGAYPEVNNVNGSYAISGAVGYFYDNEYMLEAGAGMARYGMNVRNNFFFNRKDNYDVDQYEFHLAGKYPFEEIDLFIGEFTPVVGAVISYTTRQYVLTNNITSNSSSTGTSSSFDGGFTAGLDYDISTKYAVGLDLKYMFNLSNQIASGYVNSNLGYTGSQLESLQHYTAGLSARMNF